MNDTEEDDLFPRHKPQHNRVPLTQKEIAILGLAHAYGISDIATAKLILLLRAKKKAGHAQST